MTFQAGVRYLKMLKMYKLINEGDVFEIHTGKFNSCTKLPISSTPITPDSSSPLGSLTVSFPSYMNMYIRVRVPRIQYTCTCCPNYLCEKPQ